MNKNEEQQHEIEQDNTENKKLIKKIVAEVGGNKKKSKVIIQKKPKSKIVTKIMFTYLIYFLFSVAICFITYFYLNLYYTNFNLTITNKNIVDDYTVYLLQLYINIQVINVFALQSETSNSISGFQFDYLKNSNSIFRNNSYNYSMLMNKVNDYNFSDDLKNVLSNDLCSMFRYYSLNDTMCLDFLGNSTERGLNYILSIVEQGINENYKYLMKTHLSSSKEYYMYLINQENYIFTEKKYIILKDSFYIIQKIYIQSVQDIFTTVQNILFGLIATMFLYIVMTDFLVWPHLSGLLEEETKTDLKILSILPQLLLTKDNHELVEGIVTLSDELEL